MHNPFVTVVNSLLPEPQASLLNGILFGIRATMPKNFYNSLVVTGTLHVIALSGMNISILIGIVGKVLGFMGKAASAVLTILFIVLFVLFVGPSPPVVRAAIMGSLSVIAVIFGRQYWAFLSLFISSLIMLVIRFEYIKEISFQLSFLATAGIIVASARSRPQVNRNFLSRAMRMGWESLRFTLYAQVFTAPVLLLNFGRLSLISPVANLLVEAVVAPVMILGIFVSILGWIWLPLGLIPAWIVWVPLTYFILVVEWLAKIPFASVEFY